MATAEVLLEIVAQRVPAAPLAWLERGLAQPGTPFTRGPFFACYAGAGRRFRERWLPLTARERARLQSAGIAAPEAWSTADCARALFLLHALSATPREEHLPLTTEIYRRGDTPERVALLRALSILPEPERFAELGAEACRSHVLDVFAAVACDNPFPAKYFPVLNFNQLVMKALFVELPLARILGLRERVDEELLRMAADYEAERRAAGRSVPPDLALIRAAQPH